MTWLLDLLLAAFLALGAILLALAALLLLLRLTPWRRLGVPGNALAWLVGSVLGVRRRHAIASMRAAGLDAPARRADGMYQSLGRGLCELLWITLCPQQPLAGLVQLRTAALEQLLAGGRGAVVATAHTGNWDLVACATAARLPLTVATKQLSVKWLNQIWHGARARRGVRLIEAGRIAEQAAAALGRGELVAMLVDQAPERSRATIRMPFLGQIAAVDLAPALIAMRARAPLVAAFARRRADGVHVAEVSAVFDPPRRPSRAWAEATMRELTRLLEAFVRRHPEQWLWMHRRWKGGATTSAALGRSSAPAVR